TPSRARRKLTKKKQRQRRRQKKAKERDRQEEEAEKQRLTDPDYQKWLINQEELEESQRLTAQEEEEAWLRREAIAQRQFAIDRAKKRQEQKEVERLQREQERKLDEKKENQRKLREEHEKISAKATAEFEALIQSTDEYLNNPKLEKPPRHLLRVLETHPSERPCEFFTRTNCCRYGHGCTFNHIRPMLARILLIRHFFSHSLLKGRSVHKEYASADEDLELTERDLRSDYDEFFEDAIKELEKFGTIVNFRAVRNTLEHLRGHVFVEYSHERAALRAFVNLQGRYYASRRLNVEFSNLKAWRGAVCGLSLTRKCPKGNSCGYLHLFRNPNNRFNTDLEYSLGSRSERTSSQTPTAKKASWDDQEEHARNWRWSESPELELENSKDQSNNSQKTERMDPLHKEHRSRSRSDRASSRSNRDQGSRSGSGSSHEKDRSSSRSGSFHKKSRRERSSLGSR
ncbi:hypothetical protein KR009_004883, partial [Drosophila setifemur]